MTYYNQVEMLNKQLDIWKSYSDHLRNNMKFIIVDDCSQKMPDKSSLREASSEFDIALYRITDDIFFNVPGAVNLGAVLTDTPWFLKQDMDTIVPNESMERLLSVLSEDKQNTIYKYYRVNGTKTSSSNKITPGQFCVRKDDFWKIGAWDEDFCGNYGMNDPFFFFRARALGYAVEERKDIEVYIDEEGESDIVRDVTINSELFKKKTSGKLSWSDNYLRFNWEKVYP